MKLGLKRKKIMKTFMFMMAVCLSGCVADTSVHPTVVGSERQAYAMPYAHANAATHYAPIDVRVKAK